MNWRIGGIVAFWFLVGVIVYVIIKNWGVEYWWDPVTWQIVAAIATWLLAGGVVFVILQVQQMKRSTNAQLAVDLSRELRGIEVRENFLLIYRSIYEDNTLKDRKHRQELTESEYRKIGDIVDLFELLGILVGRGIIDESLAIKLFKGPVIRCWTRLRQLIERRREDRGHYAKYFQDFAKLCVKYQMEHDSKNEWTKLQIDDEPPEYVVEELKNELLSKKELRIAKLKRTLSSVRNHSLRERI